MKNKLIKKYNVQMVPTIIMLNSDGSQSSRIETALPKEQMEKYIKELEDNEDIYYENTLFPHNETEYINYILNNAEFNNGLSIRNKYSHGTYSCDEDVQMADYIEVLKVMLMVIMRINEEFVIAADF